MEERNGYHAGGLAGGELPPSKLEVATDALAPLVGRKALTPDEWETARASLAPLGVSPRLAGQPDTPDLLTLIGDEQPDRARLQAWLEAMRPLKSKTWVEGVSPPERDWLLHGWMPAGRVSILSGIGGAGKSWLAMQLAAGVASGGRDGHWLDVPEPGMLELGAVAPAPVVYASWEDEDDEQLRRLSLISGPAAPWCTPSRCQNLHAVDLVGEGPTWGVPVGRLASSTPDLLPTGQRVRSFAEDVGARLLILDAAAAAFSGNENDRALVRAFLASWDAWARQSDCTVLLLAHPPKSGDPFSGSTDWLNACRAGITLSLAPVGAKPKGKQDNRRLAWKLELVKQNYAAKAAPFEMELETDGGLRWRVACPWDETSDDGGEADDTPPKAYQNGKVNGGRVNGFQ